MGKAILIKEANSSSIVLDMQDFADGLYFYTITTDKKPIGSGKIVLSR